MSLPWVRIPPRAAEKREKNCPTCRCSCIVCLCFDPIVVDLQYERQAVSLEEMRHTCLEMEAENRTLLAKLETANRYTPHSVHQY